MSIHATALFPETASEGTVIGSGFRNLVRESDSGYHLAKTIWPAGRSRLHANVAKELRSPAEMADMLTFYRCRDGAAHGFRFRDWSDWSTTPDGTSLPNTSDTSHRVLLGVGATGINLFPLIKNYTNGSQTTQRQILKPIPPGWADHFMAVWVDSVLQTEGTAYTVDYGTGDVRFLTAPGVGLNVHAAFTFHVPARLGSSADRGYEVAVEVEGMTARSVDVVGLVDLEFDDEPNHLGASTGSRAVVVGTEPHQLLLRDGEFQQLTGIGSNGFDLLLPVKTNLVTGGPYLTLWNSTAFSADLFDGATFIGQLPAGGIGECWLNDLVWEVD